MQEKRNLIQIKPVTILSTINERPPLAKVDVFKINNENKVLKQNLANKEFEINELKKQLKQLMNGFQMIKINSDNTHIDLAGSTHDLAVSKTGKMKMNKSFKEFSQHNRNQSKDELISSLERATTKEEIIKKLSQNQKILIHTNKSVDFNSNCSFSRNVISASHSRATSIYSQKNSPDVSDSADELYSPTQIEDSKLQVAVKKVMSKVQLPKLSSISNKNSSKNLQEYQSTSAEKVSTNPTVEVSGTSDPSFNVNALSFENSKLKTENAKLKLENENNKSRLLNISNDFSQSVIDIGSVKREYELRIKSLTNDLSFSITSLNRVQKIVNKQTELIFKYKKEKEQIQGKRSF